MIIFKNKDLDHLYYGRETFSVFILLFVDKRKSSIAISTKFMLQSKEGIIVT